MKRNLQINSCLTGLLASIFALTLITPGCGKNDQQPVSPQATTTAPAAATPPVKAVQKPVQKPVSSVAKLIPVPINQFDFSTKKDPFKPYIVVKSVSVSSKEKRMMDEKASLPIHSFDVSQFKLIGIVSGGKENRAMVTDPNGKGYVLKVGMTIGKNDGRVMAVTNSGVDILEQFRDDNGKVRKEHIKLALPRKL